VNVYPATTTDANFTDFTDVIAYSSSGNGVIEEMGPFVTSLTGNMPLVFFSHDWPPCSDGGPTTSSHTSDRAISVRWGHVPRIVSRAMFVPVTVRSSAGGRITDPSLALAVQAGAGDGWVTVGRGTAATSGRIRVSFPRRFPRHRRLGLRVVASGANYLPTSRTAHAVIIPDDKRPRAR
jgi:hypothetical protein